MSLLIAKFRAERISLILRYDSLSPVQAYNVAGNDDCSQLEKLDGGREGWRTYIDSCLTTSPSGSS